MLRQAAEEGEIDSATLREIVRKATPETEERWLQLAQSLNYRKIARIVSQTRVGEIGRAWPTGLLRRASRDAMNPIFDWGILLRIDP